MKIVIVAFGSRGDVQPGVALGAGLIAAGHQVGLASYAPFRELAESYGLAFNQVTGDVQGMLQSPAAQEMMASGRSNPLKLVRLLREEVRKTLAQSVADIVTATKQAALVISLGVAYYAGATVAEYRGIPGVVGNLQPLMPTRAFPPPLMPPPKVETGLTNWLMHQLSSQIFWQMLRPLINEAREMAYSLPPWPFFGPFGTPAAANAPILNAYSQSVLPRPGDWPANAHVTGYWFLRSEGVWQPPPDLAAFLAAGPPPVYVGFGSMSDRDPEKLAAIALGALETAGQRGVLHAGWGGLLAENLPNTVISIPDTPHDWLFPRMAAVIHHGGAGTTAAGLKAGVPTITVPFFADQPFWGNRVSRLGVGTTPIPKDRLSVNRLAVAIRRAVSDQEMQARAAELGGKIREEDGVGVAVALIDQFLKT